MTAATEDRAIEILLVEDNPADVRLTEEVLRQSEHTTNITVAEDGVIRNGDAARHRRLWGHAPSGPYTARPAATAQGRPEVLARSTLTKDW